MNELNELSPRLRDIANKILALRSMSKTTGFQTGKSQKELLMPLNPRELALVAEAVYQK
jgi:hypothetical protein